MVTQISPVRALAILPTYNEAENIGPLIIGILERTTMAEILVVDDASPDGTADLVRGLREPRVHLLERPGKLGLGSAYLAGFEFGFEHGHRRLLTMDADRSHSPDHLPPILEASEDSALVIGSRYVPGGGIRNWPLHRRLLSRSANIYARALLGLRVSDCTSGYRCYSRQALESAEAFEVRSTGYSFLYEILARIAGLGLSIAEVPIVFEQRTAGRSKIDSSEIFIAMWRVMREGLRTRLKRRGLP